MGGFWTKKNCPVRPNSRRPAQQGEVGVCYHTGNRLGDELTVEKELLSAKKKISEEGLRTVERVPSNWDSSAWTGKKRSNSVRAQNTAGETPV